MPKTTPKTAPKTAPESPTARGTQPQPAPKQSRSTRPRTTSICHAVRKVRGNAAASIIDSDAGVIVTLNLDEQAGETFGFEAADHLAVLAEHAPDLHVHTVLADERHAGEGLADLAHLVRATGAELVVDDVARDDGTARHDPVKLAAAYARIMAAADC